MNAADVLPNSNDSDVVKALKDKLARQTTIYEASAKAMTDFMSASLDARNKWKQDMNEELEELRRELAKEKSLRASQKHSVSIRVHFLFCVAADVAAFFCVPFFASMMLWTKLS